MPIPITVPRLGWNMEQGTFVAWLKQSGDEVRIGDALFTLEGDKSTQDIEATDAGTLFIPAEAPKEGDTVDVGAMLGYLLAAGETPATVTPSVVARSPDRATGLTEGLPKASGDLRSTGWAGQETGPQRVDGQETVPQRSPSISPRARRAARELGIDCSNLHGSGANGRIRERDVRAATTGRSTTPSRQTIARRMLHSVHTTAPVTLTTTADATNLVNLRAQFKEVGGDVVPAYTDVVIKLCAIALQDHPLLNSRWQDEQIVQCDGIHIGLAVDTDAGLVVPVVRNVPSLSLRQLAVHAHSLIEKARSRRLSADEMRGGTFTITNLGAYGIDTFTPIINLPECAILGLGRIRREPVVLEERIVPRDRLTLSLTFDHRIVDGAPAARFLDRVRQLIENPGPYLMS